VVSDNRTISSVLATVRYREPNLSRLRGLFDGSEFIHLDPNDQAGIAAALQRVDVAILAADLDERFLAAPNLRWVHCDHSGLNASARPEVVQSHLIVTGSAGRSGPALAQHAMFFALSLAYGSAELIDMQRKHVWRGIPDFGERRCLWGKTIGIVGMGHTGMEIAKVARVFGMRVLGYRRSATPPPGVDRLYSAQAGDTLDEMLAGADLLVLCVRLTDETYHLIGARELALMKPSAVLVSLARGPVVDTDALIAALRSGALAGAGLDVFEEEPLPADAPIWDAPNVLITPHQTVEMPDLAARSLDIIEENVRRYRAGEPMLNQLMPTDVYTVTSADHR
jgi:phosphoglycerate dehydrogenase-like enzyme